ncbi:MAG TPA: nucleotidyltransferase family protein [Desulfobulbus sp.]|nr:nucleotidyltransferase family protein [Desulfobulbus sp.]
MQAILLAAGFGTRLRPYTLIRPKPLFPVLNRPLLHILLDRLQAVGCKKIVVNCHHLAGQIQDALTGYPDVHIQIEPEILGTGGSLRLALAQLSEGPILVMNGDIFHTVDLTELYGYHLRSGNKVTLAMHNYPRFNTVGVQGERVVSFHPGSETQKLAFTGIHVVEPEVLHQIPAQSFFHIIDLYEELAVQGVVGLKRIDGAFWRDIGTAEDYLQLHRELLDSNSGIAFTGKGRRRGGWLLGENVQLGDAVQLRDWGCLGKGGRVGSLAILSRCVVWDQAEIAAGSRIFDTIVTGVEAG